MTDTLEAAVGEPPAAEPIAGPSFTRRLAAVGACALGVRLLTLLTIARRDPTGGDPLYYHLQANLLAHGHGYADPFVWMHTGRIVPSAVHPPLFTTVLAASSVVGLSSMGAHKVVACLIGTAAVAVIGLLGREVAGDRAGLVAAGIAAVYPNLWVVDGTLMPEGLAALTVALVLWVAYRFARRPRLLLAVSLGAACGLASLARGEDLLLLLICAWPLAWRRGGVRLVVAATVACGVVLAPWMIRNELDFAHPIAISTNSDEVLADSNCDVTWHGPLLGFWALSCYRGHPVGDDSQRAVYWRHEGLQYVSDHAGRLPEVLAARVGRVWNVFRPWQDVQLSTIEGRNLGAAAAGLGEYAALVPLAAVGAVTLRRRRELMWPLLTTFVAVTLTAMYAYGVIRFRMPAEVSLVVLAAVAVDGFWVRFR